jgi:hypothetical protein
MRRIRRLLGLAAAGLTMMVASPGLAKASIIDFFDSAVEAAGVWTYTYHADLTSNESALEGDYTTIYDLCDIDPASVVITQPGGQTGSWAFSIQNTGITDPLVGPTDNPAIPNLTITRVGPTLVGPQTPLFTLSFTSVQAPGSLHFFTGHAHLTDTGAPNDNISQDLLGPVCPTPEPASVVMLALGLPALGLLVARRRKGARD